MPAIYQVEFCRNLVSNSFWGRCTEQSLGGYGSRVEIPSCAASVQAQDSSDIIFQNNIDIQAAIDQTCSLEKIVVVRLPCFLGFVCSQTISWLVEAAIFVDSEKSV